VRLSRVLLLVTDFERSLRFYRDVLGLSVAYREEEQGGYAELDAGGATVALFGREQMARYLGTEHLPAEAVSQDEIALILAVDDVDAEFRRLSELGAPFVTAPHDRTEWGIRLVHLRDPDGNLIELAHDIGPHAPTA